VGIPPIGKRTILSEWFSNFIICRLQSWKILISIWEFPLFVISKNGFLLYPSTKILNAYGLFGIQVFKGNDVKLQGSRQKFWLMIHLTKIREASAPPSLFFMVIYRLLIRNKGA